MPTCDWKISFEKAEFLYMRKPEGLTNNSLSHALFLPLICMVLGEAEKEDA